MSTCPDFIYMPILKWKQGEQIALRHIPDSDRLVTLPLVEFQPMVAKGTKTVGEIIKTDVAKTVLNLTKAKATDHPIAIDTSAYLPDPAKQAKTLATICGHLAKNNILVFPVLHPSMLSSSAADVASLKTFDDIVLRIKMTTCLPQQVGVMISDVYSKLGRKSFRLHILLDMFSIVGDSPAPLILSVAPYVDEAIKSNKAKSITLAGGSFPFNLTGIPKGISSLTRVEWLVWSKLLKKYEQTRICFGDYAVTNPEPLEEIDPTKINPSAAIRYALKDEWMLLKAGGVRSSGFQQYNDLCNLLLSDPAYSGEPFSFGDSKYHQHAQPGASTGNLSTWRRDATSHHLALTVRNCAKLFGISI